MRSLLHDILGFIRIVDGIRLGHGRVFLSGYRWRCAGDLRKAPGLSQHRVDDEFGDKGRHRETWLAQPQRLLLRRS
jgi:hypothetical protein